MKCCRKTCPKRLRLNFEFHDALCHCTHVSAHRVAAVSLAAAVEIEDFVNSRHLNLQIERLDHADDESFFNGNLTY